MTFCQAARSFQVLPAPDRQSIFDLTSTYALLPFLEFPLALALAGQAHPYHIANVFEYSVLLNTTELFDFAC